MQRSDYSVPTFRDNLLVPSSRVKKSKNNAGKALSRVLSQRGADLKKKYLKCVIIMRTTQPFFTDSSVSRLKQ